MTYKELKELVMLQTNNDVDDLEEYESLIDQYLNEGYVKLHIRYDGTTPEDALELDTDEPDLPPRSHGAIADYATYRMYMLGNAAKQSRGASFLAQYEQIAREIGKASERYTGRFKNLYTM